MNWTKAMVDAQNARIEAITALKTETAPVPDDAPDLESPLHQDIIAECKRRAWICFHGSMAHKTYRTLGEPDFTILMDSGRWIMIECKSRTGKLDDDQRDLAHWAARLGHKIHVVRSFSEFLHLIKTQ